jgi:hypothetical protein
MAPHALTHVNEQSAPIEYHSNQNGIQMEQTTHCHEVNREPSYSEQNYPQLFNPLNILEISDPFMNAGNNLDLPILDNIAQSPSQYLENSSVPFDSVLNEFERLLSEFLPSDRRF